MQGPDFNPSTPPKKFTLKPIYTPLKSRMKMLTKSFRNHYNLQKGVFFTIPYLNFIKKQSCATDSRQQYERVKSLTDLIPIKGQSQAGKLSQIKNPESSIVTQSKQDDSINSLNYSFIQTTSTACSADQGLLLQMEGNKQIYRPSGSLPPLEESPF